MSPLPMVQLFNRSVFGASGEETNLIIMIEIIINNNYCADYHKSQHYDDHEKFWLKICWNGVLVTTWQQRQGNQLLAYIILKIRCDGWLGGKRARLTSITFNQIFQMDESFFCCERERGGHWGTPMIDSTEFLYPINVHDMAKCCLVVWWERQRQQHNQTR